MANRDEIVSFLDKTLRTSEIKDSSCNGLQVQGTGDVRRVGLAVDACMESYEAAGEAGCQMLIVHHGLIWHGLRSITGRVHRHLQLLIAEEMNLYASHLPLDMHPEYGNNIRLARLLGLRGVKPFGSYENMLIGFQGTLPAPSTPDKLAAKLAASLGGKPLVLGLGPAKVRTVGVVSGGAGGMVDQCAGLDCYVTGETVHHSYQLARETGTNVVFAGHYHSEKPGVQAVGALLARKFGVKAVFLEIGAFNAQTGE
jgi:dinuclear metal center YbgI/SA1388 family protein